MNQVEVHVVWPALIAHVVDVLNPLLPGELSLVDTGGQIALLAGTRPPRTVSTHSPNKPESMTLGDVPIHADHLLSDLQDLVAMHVRTPWPVTGGGRSTYAKATADGDRVRIGFVSSDGTEAVTLPDFVVGGPGRTVVAG